MNLGVGSLPFIGLIIGEFLAGAFTLLDQKSYVKKLRAKNNTLSLNGDSRHQFSVVSASPLDCSGLDGKDGRNPSTGWQQLRAESLLVSEST